jgi:hypothetical protein
MTAGRKDTSGYTSLIASCMIGFVLGKVGKQLVAKKLHSCVRCGLTSKLVVILKHYEWIDDGGLKRLSKQFYVLCLCNKRLLFDSEKKAAAAWNKTNPILK